MTALFAASGPTPLWYLARGSGLVSLLFLTASVVLGVVTTARWGNERWPRFTVSFVHRNLSLLAVVFLVVHIATMVLDGFAPIGWKDAVIPFVSPYRALWLGLGALAFDVFIAVIITSLLRNRVGARTWRVMHWLSYPLWALAVLHGLGTGTDTHTAVLLIANALCVTAVIVAVWWRCTIAGPRQPVVRGAAFAVIVILPIALVAWLFAGPLAAGWSSRAGTPAGLLAGTTSSASTAAAPAPSGPSGKIGPGFAANFDGTLRESGSGQQLTVAIDGQLSRGASGTLTMSINAADNATGSLLVRDGTVQVVDGSGHTTFDGSVAGVRDGVLIAQSNDASATQLAIQFDTFDTRSGSASGTVQTLSGGGGDSGRGSG